MKNYEVLYIVKPIDEKVVDSNVSKFNEGIYILMKFKAKFDRVMKLNDLLLRHMIIRLGE